MKVKVQVLLSAQPTAKHEQEIRSAALKFAGSEQAIVIPDLEADVAAKNNMMVVGFPLAEAAPQADLVSEIFNSFESTMSNFVDATIYFSND